MTKPLFVDMTKPLFSASHLALHSFGHHHPAWLPPPPSPRGAWSPTSFPRGVTTAFFPYLPVNPISPCYCRIAFPPITDFKGWQQSKSTHNMQVSWPACTFGGEHRTEHRAPVWPKFRAALRSEVHSGEDLWIGQICRTGSPSQPSQAAEEGNFFYAYLSLEYWFQSVFFSLFATSPNKLTLIIAAIS